ncbi:LysR substrate-binding domain-containing protein [Paenibacillus sp. TAB 01]|uniref:LysR substrate-binding domain-containing protein n=1 Tax=Paenibacillus sp. TAB 01 TaxID=3368988 RepID=UPI0037509C6B
MNLHALKLFYETIACGGVTKAADKLHLSQPAVTAQIRNLEQELGLPLLAPKGRGVQMTSAGELLYKHASRLFSLERSMLREMAEYRDGLQGTLHLCATYLPANYMLPAWMTAYRQANQGIRISLTTANSKAAYRQLLHYEADLAFIGGSREEPEGVVREELLEDELWFVVPAGHRLADTQVTLEEIVREPFILREEGSSTREKLLALCRLHNLGAPAPGLQFNGLSETIRAVSAGYGASFLSALEVREAVLEGKAARVYISDAQLTNPIAVCMRADEELSPAAGSFLTWVREKIEQL